MKEIACFILIALLILSIPIAYAETLTGAEILKRVDKNFETSGRVSTNTMIIKGRRGTRKITTKVWVEGSEEKAFTDFLSPPREKGTKMLKLDKELWIRNPSSDRIIKLAGHMLRQSMMGSDASYEDFMEDTDFTVNYDVNILGEEEVDKRNCYILKLKAKPGKSPSYFLRKIWVDKERYLALKEDLFAKSGKLLKTMTVNEVFQIDHRWYPKVVTYKDVLKSGDGTMIVIDSIKLDVKIPKYIFSKASLKK